MTMPAGMLIGASTRMLAGMTRAVEMNIHGFGQSRSLKSGVDESLLTGMALFDQSSALPSTRG